MKYPKISEISPWAARYPEEVSQMIEEELDSVHSEFKEKDLKRLQKRVKAHPDVPELYSALYQAYQKMGKNTKSSKVLEEMQQHFPNYLFTRVFSAQRCLDEEDLKGVSEWLGSEPDLNRLYPEQEFFHPGEVAAFYNIAFAYYMKSDQLQKAKEVQDLLSDTLADYPFFSELTLNMMSYFHEYTEDHFENFLVKGEEVERWPGFQTDELPVFQNPKVEQLYQLDFFADNGSPEDLLELPEESLIDDLETLLEDAIQRFAHFSAAGKWDMYEHAFPMHAVLLLTELEAKDSLPVIFQFLRQGRQFLEFWFNDLLEPVFIPVLYRLAYDRPQELMDFMKEPGTAINAKGLMSSVCFQIVLHEPQRREEILARYCELLDFLYEQRDNEQVYSQTLLSFIIIDLVNLGAIELEASIRRFYVQQLIDKFNTGDWPMVLEGLQYGEPDMALKKELPDSLEAHYEQVWEEFNFPDDGFDFDFTVDSFTEEERKRVSQAKKIKSSEGPLTSHKVGRNDPCPCGSGKKFKKCCGRNV